MFLVFDWGVFELGRGNREEIGWLGDRHGGDLGTDLFGEKNALLDGLGSEIRPISRDQDVLEHYSFLLPLFLYYLKPADRIKLASQVAAGTARGLVGLPVGKWARS